MKKIWHTLENIIFSFFSLFELFYLRFFIIKKKKVYLLISHDLSQSGAPRVLLDTAKLINKNYNGMIVVVTNSPGELLIPFMKVSCMVISAKYFQRYFQNEILNINYEFILVNTIAAYSWVWKLEGKGKKFIWWIHEGYEYLNIFNLKLPRRLSTNADVWYVSKWVEEAMSNFGINYLHQIVPYYVSENVEANWIDRVYKSDNSIFTVTIIGSICARKNQMELLSAVKKIPKKLRKSIRVRIIGTPIEDNYFVDLKKFSVDLNVSFEGGIKHSEIWNVYCSSDIIVCSSKDDPLPVVVSEAFKYGTPVIMSSHVGQYHIIEGTKLEDMGLTYISGDAEMLSSRISNMLMSNLEQKKIISSCEKKIYKENFSLDNFFHNIEI